MPFAIHITWTTYGTWLPGDNRGHVSNTLLQPSGFMPAKPAWHAVRPGDQYTRKRAQKLMTQDPVWLTPSQGLRAAESMVEAVKKRQWRIRRAAVMANHVHALVTECPDDGPAVRRILKGVSQSALSKSVGHHLCWWTADGSDRYKHDDAAIDAAYHYIANQVGKLAEVIDNVATACVVA